ncbi:hypothetical protein P171DRAFT_446995 [Karstenula rhodostoma CBS 690.94]|uniref:Zn(2)-C6 fungal-type domain-containing protein n=1 Tax=Karstenula rhodostoma CBS 690.94 TaxID=1392251 RepID=A0A9P4U8P2_9PLEO|nr:hypothetical protein P171DRAFT_446995 [Karstenula rhodostoma CBS 690.94]
MVQVASDMEFGQGYRYGPHGSIGYPLQQYQHNGRDTAFAIPNGARVNRRVCPVRVPIGSTRLHIRGDDNETGQSRRRVAVACARCRKRKIRCSGDPGDGTACHNCTSAGVDPSNCQFHRVGSGEAASMIDLHNFNQITSSHQTMMQMYNPPSSPVRSRPLTYPSGLDTKSIVPQAWYSSPFNSEATSPVENYGLDHSAVYLPTQSSVAYSGSYGWSTDSKNVMNNYLGHDSSLYRTHGHPYAQHNIRNVASSDALSHSMTSLQLTLPERPHTRSGLPVSQRPQLPIPQPSPAQTTRNVVDQLQDRRLRSVQAMGGSSLSNGGFTKPPLPFSSDTDIQVATTTDALSTQITSSAPASTTDTVSCFPSTATSTEALPDTPAPQFDFSTSPLFDSMPAPAQPTYSNFRDSQEYKPMTSSPTKTTMPMARQVSHNSFYSVGSGSSSKSASGASDSMLVSGHRYTPLSQNQNQPHHQASSKSVSNNTAFPVHRSLTTPLNRSY